jgi:subtilisin family serine protease
MRLFLIILACAISSGCLFSQSRFNNALKVKLAQKNAGDEVHTVLVKGNIALLRSSQQQLNYKFNYSARDIASITCKIKDLALLLDQKIISYAEFISSHIRPMNDTMLVRNRIKSVKLGASPLPQAYNGDGIVMGIIDSGIDFSHPDFKDSLGNSRILFLWDQNPLSGSTVPSPFNYGIEWTNTQIDAGQCTHSDLAHYGHGTHVSGIAAGNGLANNSHYGCASKADLVVVALDFSGTGAHTADAVQYILDKATNLGKPCVINASVGDYYGSHDGTDLEAQLIDGLISNTPGRVMVAAAGNGGNIKFHVKTQGVAADTNFTWLKNASTSYDYWLYADTNDAKTFSISIGANRANFSDVGRIGFKPYTYGLTSIQHDTLKLNGNRIGIIANSSGINSFGVYELYIEIIADTANLLWRVETKGPGKHHAWNFDFVSTGIPTASQYPKITKYVTPDTMYTLVTSYQCSDEIITVGNYANLTNYYDVNNNLQSLGQTGGAMVQNSSSGPTRDGRQKPDISATGNGVFSCIALGMQANLIANAPHVVAQGSMHVRGGGTSAASPVVAGLAALYLERHPLATNQQVKYAITHCAYTDNFTGTNLPDYLWGYGKLDGKAAMTCGENIVTVGEAILEKNVRYFPNPFNGKVTINLEKIISGKIEVYAVDGTLCFEDVFIGQTYTLLAEKLKSHASRLFIVKVTDATDNYVFKLVKE